MMRINRHVGPYVIGIVLAMLLGCVTKTTVLVPPRVELVAYRSIGLVEFSSNRGETGLERLGSQELMRTVQSAQPGTRILELGPRHRVLAKIEREEFDFEAIRAIGEHYRVDAVLMGRMEFTDITPKLRISPTLESLRATAEIEAFLSARLLETESGATLWTSSARERTTVAHFQLLSSRPASFGAGDPNDAQRRLVQGLVRRITRDFRAHYERR